MRIVFIFLIVGLCVRAQAATITAAGVGSTEVQAAVNSAVDGDTVVIPAGTATWTVNVDVIGKGITIIGAGWGQTIIIDDLPFSSNQGTSSLFYWSTQAGDICRISQIEFRNGVRTTENLTGALFFGGNSTQVRIDHIKMVGVRNRGVQISDAVLGVGDHNWFQVEGESVYTEHDTLFGGINGNGSWENPVVPGSATAFYWEDNVLINKSTDSCGGAREVWRFNNLTNVIIGRHGTDTTADKRAGRWAEVYGNNFYNPTANASRDKFFDARDGGFLICSNTVAGDYTGSIKLNTYRRFASFGKWKGADGTNDWDLNDPVLYESGTATGGASLQMTDSTKSWTVNQWRGYALKNTTSNRFSLITGNTATTITYNANGFGATMIFAAGNQYEIRRVIQCLDQNGAGQSDPINTSSPTWLNQAAELCYQWANTRNGVTVTMSAGAFANIVEGLHFTNNVAHPTWTPYTYPHPLIAITEGNVPDPTITVQPQSQTIIIGNTASLSVTASGTAPLSYQWHEGAAGTENPIGGATSSSYTTPALTETKSYWVRVSNGLGSMDSSTATITVTGVAPTITTQPQSQTIANGESATLTVIADGTGTLSYQWYRGTSGTTTNPDSGATSATFEPSPTSTTSYWVRVSNAFGTIDSATATVTVTPTAPPIINGSGSRNPRSKIYWKRR